MSETDQIKVEYNKIMMITFQGGEYSVKSCHGCILTAIHSFN